MSTGTKCFSQKITQQEIWLLMVSMEQKIRIFANFFLREDLRWPISGQDVFRMFCPQPQIWPEMTHIWAAGRYLARWGGPPRPEEHTRADKVWHRGSGERRQDICHEKKERTAQVLIIWSSIVQLYQRFQTSKMPGMGGAIPMSGIGKMVIEFKKSSKKKSIWICSLVILAVSTYPKGRGVVWGLARMV